MKHFFTIAAICIISVLAASCTKNELTVPAIQDEQEVFNYETYDLALRFQAEGVDEAPIYVYDKDLVQIAIDNIVVPETDSEVVDMNFVSESAPEYIYTPGLDNGDENTGFLHIGGKNIQTKAGSDGTILIVIKKQ